MALPYSTSPVNHIGCERNSIFNLHGVLTNGQITTIFPDFNVVFDKKKCGYLTPSYLTSLVAPGKVEYVPLLQEFQEYQEPPG